MKKKKILTIGSTERTGGAAGVSWDIAEKLRSEDYWVRHMVGYKTSNNKYVYQFKQPKILQTLDKITKINVVSFFRELRSYIFANDIDFGVTNELLQHPWYKEADVIHLHNLHGDFLNLKTLIEVSKNKSVIWTLHDMWPFTGHCTHSFSCNRWQKGCGSCPNLKTYRPQAWDNTANIFNKKKIIYQKSKLNIVAPSQWLYKKLNKSIFKNQSKHLIYNGIDTHIFKIVSAKKAKQKLKLPINKKTILFVAHGGKSNVFKGGEYLDFLVKMYKSNPDILFVCIGEERKNLPQETNIIYLPHIKDQKKLSLYFSAADIFLFTSQAENCPLVVLEALSAGVPILSFPIGGIPEIIEHKKNGYLSKINDKTDLQKGVNYLLNMKDEEVDLMKKNNRKKALKYFSTEKMVDSYKKIYEQI